MGTADNEDTVVEGFCSCEDWETCGCGNQPPYHCMYCCKTLTPEQLATWNFETWDHIPPSPRGLPLQITCGQCCITIDNPTQEQVDFHFSEEHNEL